MSEVDGLSQLARQEDAPFLLLVVVEDLDRVVVNAVPSYEKNSTTSSFLPIHSDMQKDHTTTRSWARFHIRENAMDCSSHHLLQFFSKAQGKLMRVNALMAVNTILMGVIVSIATYGHRYRYHRLTRFIFLGATSLFMPIVSYVVSAVNSDSTITISEPGGNITADCDPRDHITLLLIWTGLVQSIGINITAIVASDAREGRKVGPSIVLLVQAMWASYLAIYQLVVQGAYYEDGTSRLSEGHWTFLPLFTLVFAKLLLKYYAWHKATQSLMLGRSPRFIVGYMEQLQDVEVASEPIPPPLIVTGEDTVRVRKQTRGYIFERMSNRGDTARIDNNDGLVTLDEVWQLNDNHLKDVCLSFALFKLLRCRFARYTFAEYGFKKARNFLWHMLLEDNYGERLFGVIECELSFLHDFYYSSLPVSYSKSSLPIFSMFISLIIVLNTIVTCCYLAAVFSNTSTVQLLCTWVCSNEGRAHISDWAGRYFGVGHLYFDIVPVILLSTLVMLREVAEIASYIFSNWTKVVLICSCIRHASWLQSPTIQKCVGHVLQHRCKLFQHWENEMNQCSILVLHTQKTPVALLRRFVALPDQNIKVPMAVKTAIVEALRSYGRSRNNNGVTYLSRNLQLKFGDKLLWTFNSANGIAFTMLVCHIATSIFEVRSRPGQLPSDNKVAAIHLSRYCAYLVAYHPELLPDDYEWCKSLYNAVKKDAGCLACCIAVITPEDDCQQLVELLSARSKHKVLRNGMTLGGRLAELVGVQETGLVEAEETVWKALAGFWSEMILHVAPSSNMDGHAKAIARGGELITLLWALLTHLGIDISPDDSAVPADAHTSVPV
uniref:Uncharacterized protein n=1 Tax=Avena sativa TaxID=4498 RepID=A0ACD5YRR9_AVESA